MYGKVGFVRLNIKPLFLALQLVSSFQCGGFNRTLTVRTQLRKLLLLWKDSELELIWRQEMRFHYKTREQRF